jgi:hypothetical protein
VLETSRVQRVGSTSEREVDVRVISTSAVQLGELVARGAFRADLYYRLRQLEVAMPPLRERVEDIAALVRHFLKELARQTGEEPQVSAAAMAILLNHSWPGNCRELRNTIRSAALMAGHGTILPGHLPHSLQPTARVEQLPQHSALRTVEHEHILQTLDRVGWQPESRRTDPRHRSGHPGAQATQPHRREAKDLSAGGPQRMVHPPCSQRFVAEESWIGRPPFDRRDPDDVVRIVERARRPRPWTTHRSRREPVVAGATGQHRGTYTESSRRTTLGETAIEPRSCSGSDSWRSPRCAR